MPSECRNSQEHILYLLKTKGPLTAQALADRIKITAMGVRQHLKRLDEDGLVAHHDERSGVGRPARHWSITTLGNGRFPDSHSDLTVSLLGSVRRVFGAKGLNKLIDARTLEQTRLYREQIDGRRSIENRLASLAEQRTTEGYMSDWHQADDGSYVLVENHCPISAAAQFCEGLWHSELNVFQEVLGTDVVIERMEHLLTGARRSAYRITVLDSAA